MTFLGSLIIINLEEINTSANLSASLGEVPNFSDRIRIKTLLIPYWGNYTLQWLPVVNNTE